MNWVVKKGTPNLEDTPLEKWTTDQMCNFFRRAYQTKFRVETRRPHGQIKAHINQKSINLLYKFDGFPKDISKNELFKNFIDWVVNRYPMKYFRIGLFSKYEVMVDFLDERAQKKVESELGTFEEFEKQEKAKIKEVEEYYKNLGLDEL